MFIFGFNEILTAWFNDAHIITFFVFILFLPLLIQFVRKKYLEVFPEYFRSIENKNIFFRLLDSNIEIITAFNLILFLTGLSGFFQLIIPLPFADGIIRAIGIALYILSLFSLFIFYRNYFHVDRCAIDKIGFFKIVRHPEELLILILNLSFGLQTLNLVIIAVTITALIPSIYLRLKHIEKPLIQTDSFYLDYTSEVPLLFPDLFKIIKLIFF